MNRAMRRVQMIVFWLVYYQTAHTRAKTFFQNIQTNRPLSIPVLDVFGPAITPAAADPVLLGIFRGEVTVTDPETQAFHDRHTGNIPPFVTPFGPSVLRCGFSTCAEPFTPAYQLPGLGEKWTPSHEDALRAGRAAHLAKAFGIHKDFTRTSQTGMPTPTSSPAPPNNPHTNTHISIAWVWARLDKTQRAKVAADSEKGAVDEFVKDVSFEIYDSRRGDVFAEAEDDVRQILPSFFEALKLAVKVEQGGEGDITEYVIDFDKNKLQLRAEYEIMVLAKNV